MSSVTRTKKVFEYITGVSTQLCAGCGLDLPIDLFRASKHGAYSDKCFYCTKEGNAPSAEDAYMTKCQVALITHVKRMGIQRDILVSHYGWSPPKMRDLLISSLQLPCPYCTGLHYGTKGTPLSAIGAGNVSWDVVVNGEPFFSNCKWCCIDCNRIKRDMPIEWWQAYCNHLERWLLRKADVMNDIYLGPLFEDRF